MILIAWCMGWCNFPAMQTKIGAEKQAAGACGLPLEEYRRRRDAGEKRCNVCKQWKPEREFNIDRSRGDGLYPGCRDCQNARSRAKYTVIPFDKRKPYGPSPGIPRDGDKKQARSRVNKLVQRGRLPRPNDVRCSRCGHIGNDKRHEYHHQNGYGKRFHTDVTVLCTTCHHIIK